MRLIAHANVLGYNAGETFTIDDDDTAGLAAVEPYIIGRHVETIAEDVEVDVVLTPEATVALLKGHALADALTAAGLPNKGSADDKRAALLAALTTDGNDAADDGLDADGSAPPDA